MTQADSSRGKNATAVLEAEGVVYEFSGLCSDLSNLGRATYFGTDEEARELSVVYTYPDDGFDASGGFAILTASGDLVLESGGLTAASFDGSEMVVESGLRSGTTDDAGNGRLVVICP